RKKNSPRRIERKARKDRKNNSSRRVERKARGALTWATTTRERKARKARKKNSSRRIERKARDDASVDRLKATAHGELVEPCVQRPDGRAVVRARGGAVARPAGGGAAG